MARVPEKVLCTVYNTVFTTLGLSIKNAQICSRVLLDADLRGITSHGVSSLQRYVHGIEEGIILPKATMKVLRETPVSVMMDAGGIMGMVSSQKVMAQVIKKAQTSGIGMGVVKNANHFGFGAYYAMQASKKNMIGIAYSNTAAIVAPTHGTKAMLGTNPISFAAPCNTYPDFVLDMATTVVPRGKIQQYANEHKSIPEGWAIDDTGEYVTNPAHVLDLLNQGMGGLLPLGGKGTHMGGHKGYGLSVMVDVLTGILSGFRGSYQIRDTQLSAGRSAQSFLVIRIDIFRDITEFKSHMDDFIEHLIRTPAQQNTEMTVHGLKESERTTYQKKHGVGVDDTTYSQLVRIARSCGIDIDALLHTHK